LRISGGSSYEVTRGEEGTWHREDSIRGFLAFRHDDLALVVGAQVGLFGSNLDAEADPEEGWQGLKATVRQLATTFEFGD
jgi:hypothetical protein